MRDRLPTPGKENRVRIRQDNGQVVEGVLEYADDATQAGSAYTKGNVLPDDVCTAYGLDTDIAEPKDAFLAIPGLMGKCFLLITVKKIDGTPYQGVLVNGLSGVDTPRRTTNKNGQVALYVNAGTYNLTFAPNPVCVDTTIPGKSITLASGGRGTVETKEQSNGLTSLDITSSRSVAFSAKVRNLDVFCVGGGGAGANGGDEPSGGGGGGRTGTVKNASFAPYSLIQATVGSGGAPADNYGNPGGTTSFGSILSVQGGDGGTNQTSGTYWKGGDGGCGGGGGNTYEGGSGGSNGGEGGGSRSSFDSPVYSNQGRGQGTSTRAFGDSSGQLFAGGGGGGQAGSQPPTNSGGAGGGGKGGYKTSSASNGQPNTGGGGGGGGKDIKGGTPAGGSGGSGIIKLRWVNVF